MDCVLFSKYFLPLFHFYHVFAQYFFHCAEIVFIFNTIL